MTNSEDAKKKDLPPWLQKKGDDTDDDNDDDSSGSKDDKDKKADKGKKAKADLETARLISGLQNRR